MAGWLEALGQFAGAGQDALGRYQQMRQLDQENIWRNRQMAMQEEQNKRDQELHQLQLKNLTKAMLGQDRQDFLDTYGPGSRFGDEQMQEANRLGLGGQVRSTPTMDLQKSDQPMSLIPGVQLPGQSYTPQFSEQNIFQGTNQQQQLQRQQDLQSRMQNAQLDKLNQESRLDSELNPLQIALTRNQVAGSELTNQRAQFGLQGEQQFRQWMAQHPNAHPSAIANASAQFGTGMPEGIQSLLNQQTQLGVANAGLERQRMADQARMDIEKLKSDSRTQQLFQQNVIKYAQEMLRQQGRIASGAAGIGSLDFETAVQSLDEDTLMRLLDQTTKQMESNGNLKSAIMGKNNGALPMMPFMSGHR